MKAKPQFSLILACYNEEDNLKKTVEISITELKKLFSDFEIIIIDDKSQDDSPKITDSLARKNPKYVKVIHSIINLGQGISFLIGLHLSEGELVMQNGADRPFNIRDLKKILPLFAKNDIVVVARANRQAYTFWRKITSWGNILLRGILFGFKYSDLNFVQIYKRKVIRNISIAARSAAFTSQELVLKAAKKGYQITEIKLPYHRRVGGLAHHGKKRDILWAAIDMFNYWLEKDQD